MPKKIIFALSLIFILLIPACSLRGENNTEPTPVLPTNTPLPTSAPTGTPTPLPPKPEVGYTPVANDELAPVVVQRFPRRGESLTPDGAVSLYFDQPMNPDTIAKAFSLQLAGDSTPVEGEFSWISARNVQFKPAKPLPRAATYDVILTQDVQAQTGSPLRQPYTFRFATVGFLEVGQVIPAPGTTDTETDSTITVMFNRPVVPLTSLEEMEDLPQPLSFEPQIDGSGEWLNTSIYVFTPDTALSGGVTYTAKVSAGLTGTDGATLAEDYVWQFSTVPPQIVWTTPRDGQTLVDINTPVTVQFNQPISLESAKQAFSLTRDGLFGDSEIEGEFAIKTTAPTPSPEYGIEPYYAYEEDPSDYDLNPARPQTLNATLVFTPGKALDFNQTYTVNIEPGVTSSAGGEGMREGYRWKFTTVPLPKIVRTVPTDGENNADPHTGFQIVFNTRINPKTVMPNIKMTPPLSPTQVYTWFSEYDNTFNLSFGAQPSTDYEVVISDGIADPYGNTIPRGRTVNFRTANLPPNYQLRTPDFVATYDASQPAQIVVGSINIHRINFSLYKLPISVLEQPYWDLYEYVPSAEQQIRQWQENIEAPLNKQWYTAVNLSETPGATLEPGIYLLDSNSPDIPKDWYYNQKHILIVSDYNLTLKVGPKEAMVWATDLTNGQPASNLPLTFYEYYHGPLETLTTDSDGLARLSLGQYHDTIVAYSESPFAAVSDNWGYGISPWDFGLGEGVYEQPYRAYLYTDRPIYRPGQTVNFKGILRAENDAEYRLADVGQVNVAIRDAAYTEIYNKTLPVSELGSFNDSIDLESGASLGQYVIALQFNDHYQETYFQVAAYRPPEFEIRVTFTPPLNPPPESEGGEGGYQRGDDLKATVDVAYFFGGGLPNTPVEWNLLSEDYRFTVPWGGRYTFSDTDDPYACWDCWWWEPYSYQEPIMSGNGVTDNNGQLRVEIDGAELEQALIHHASKLTLEATASGPDNQFISGRSTVIMNPGPYYIGLSPQEYVSNAGEQTAIDLVTVDWEGNRLPDKEIKVEFYLYEWINTFVKNDFGGGYWDWEIKETLVDETIVTTDELGEAVASFIPAKGGSYRVVAFPSPAEGGGGIEGGGIRSSVFIWVAGEDDVSWRRDNNDRINLVSDKLSYKVGDVAEILIPSPFSGPHYALVTVERAGILRHEVVLLENNSAIYRLPITEEDIPNIYVSVALVKGRVPLSAPSPDTGGDTGGGNNLAEFKLGILPFDIALEPKTLTLKVEANTEQAEPGQDVTYTVSASQPDGSPAVGAELSLDVVDKAVLSLQPRTSDILSAFYARRALEVRTAAGLSVSANLYLQELADDLELELDVAQADNGGFYDEGVGGGAADSAFVVEEAEKALEALAAPAPQATALASRQNVAPPEGVEIREQFADTALWEPAIVTDEAGQASVTLTLPDNLTTWTFRGVGLTAETVVGEQTSDLVATMPLLIRPVAPRFFVVDDRAQLAANVSNNTAESLDVEVTLSAEGVTVSEETPAVQTITIPANSEAKVTWNVTAQDVVSSTLIFSAVSGEYADASKPRLTTGPDGSLLVFRYTAPDIVGTAGQLTEGGSRTEAIALPPPQSPPTGGGGIQGGVDERDGALTIKLDPSLAAAMQDSLTYLEHYEYECTEQTVSRFLPNVVTYQAVESLGLDNPELEAKLPALVDEGLAKLYQQQNPDGGWGWWHTTQNWQSNPYVSAYVVFALLKTQEAGIEVSNTVLANGLNYLQTQVTSVRQYKGFREANQQAWLLYVLAEGDVAPQDKLDELFENRQKLSYYARAYLAQALWLNDKNDPRLDTLLSDLSNNAILSATGAHWEENDYDWWAMNTDTRSTAIILDTLTKLDPDNALNPNVVRWLMVTRKVGIWETTQENAWAIIALTDWMLETGELEAEFDYGAFLNDEELINASVTPETVRDNQTVIVPIADLLADTVNALTIARSDGNGRLYYTAHLEVYLPVEEIEAAERGIIVSRRYTLANCDLGPACPEVREAKLGDVIRVDLTIIAPNDLYYIVVEDPLPAGGEAIDTGLATTSMLAMDPSLSRQNSRYWQWWNWYSRSELRDEKVVLFADYLSKGTYEYSYTFRATLPGDYHVIPTVAREFYFPEVFGRSDGRLLSIGE